MGQEINIDRIRDLEKQIEEGSGDLIKLKRARNSLLNISTIVPPEILGSIFRWNVVLDEGLLPSVGLPKGAYNFLLVCHHWSEVASHTPELWGFWGDTLEKWSRRYKRSRATPVDLVLKGPQTRGSATSFHGPLRNALRDHAAYDSIRSVHLQNKKRSLATSILSTLTPDGEDVRCSSIELINLRHVDASKFFARYRFPKLRYLDLSTGVGISSWEDIALRTTALTTLTLTIDDAPHVLTTPQLLLILASNPRLRNLTLSKNMIPQDNEHEPAVTVPLRHLKKLSLSGDFHPVSQLLCRLDHPETMDLVKLSVSRCTVEDISGPLGLCVGGYIRRDGRYRDGLGFRVTSLGNQISIQASAVSSVTVPVQKVVFAEFIVILERLPPFREEDKLCIKFFAHVPREHVVYFCGNLGTDTLREAVAAMPKIQELHLFGPQVYDGFLLPDLGGPHAKKKLLPSLRHLHLDEVFLSQIGWSPIIPFLTHQTSDGQGISLTISGPCKHICKYALRKMGRLVEGLVLNIALPEYCPYGYCGKRGRRRDIRW